MKQALLGLALAFGLTMALPAEASDCYGETPAKVVYKQPQAKPQPYSPGKKFQPGHKGSFQQGKKFHQKEKRQSLRAQMEQLDAAGKLSRKERLTLEKNLADLRALRQQALSDGVLTAAEKAKLQAARQVVERNLKIAALS